MANYSGTGSGSPIPSTTTVTATEIIKLGQITPTQFNMEDLSALEDLVESYLPAAKKEVEFKTGGTGFQPLDDEKLIQMANNAVMYLTLHQMFTGLGSTTATNHDEPMPTEFRSVSGELIRVSDAWRTKYNMQVNDILLSELSL